MPTTPNDYPLTVLAAICDHIDVNGDMNNTLLDVIMARFEDGEYDGLFHPDVGCACKKDDLAPCGHIGTGCCYGYAWDGEYEFFVGTKEARDDAERTCKEAQS